MNQDQDQDDDDDDDNDNDDNDDDDDDGGGQINHPIRHDVLVANRKGKLRLPSRVVGSGKWKGWE